jgi:hypothetical protein
VAETDYWIRDMAWKVDSSRYIESLCLQLQPGSLRAFPDDDELCVTRNGEGCESIKEKVETFLRY